MSTATVAIDRTSLSLSDLSITDDGTTYRIGFGGLERPAITWRTTNMPDSADVHGSEPIAAVMEQSSLPLTVIVLAASSSALAEAVDDLTDALSQFSYDTTVTVDGVSKVWSCSPASWAFDGSLGPENVAQFFEVVKAVIPVYPIPGTS